jgi:hypothetical protein
MRRSHDISSRQRWASPFTVSLPVCSRWFLLSANVLLLVVICIPRIGAFAHSATCPHGYHSTMPLYQLGCFGTVAFLLVQTVHTNVNGDDCRTRHDLKDCSPACASPVRLQWLVRLILILLLTIPPRPAVEVPVRAELTPRSQAVHILVIGVRP